MRGVYREDSVSLDRGGMDVGRSETPLHVKILSLWTPMLSGRTSGWGGKFRVALPASLAYVGGGGRHPGGSTRSALSLTNHRFYTNSIQDLLRMSLKKFDRLRYFIITV